MSSEGGSSELDMKLFIKAVNDQFRLLNARMDDLQSNRRSWRKEEEDSNSDEEKSSPRRGKTDGSKRDSSVGNIKMTIPPQKR